MERIQLTIAGLCTIAALALALLPLDWIETVFGVEPDAGSGFAELLPIVAFALVAFVLTIRVGRAKLARRRAGLGAVAGRAN
jgi:hypothetical protein